MKQRYFGLFGKNKMVHDFLSTASFLQMERDVFSSIQRIFPCEEELSDTIPMDRIIAHFQKDLVASEHPFLIRVSGQSGSGKSTQLIPALQDALGQRKYIKINVGAFAVFHPQYETWQKNEPDKMRENTNGFALKALILFYKYCILNRISVVLDMTLLEPEIDIYLMALAKEMGYKIQMHLLCVPKRISDLFIRLRQKQTGRYVRPKSGDYFFNALAPSLKALVSSKLFGSYDRLILWTHDLSYPVRHTHLNNPFALCILQKYRERHFRVRNSKSLLNSKKIWMKLFVRYL